MSITGELQRARQLALAAKEEAAKELLLSLMPEIEREDRDDLALEAFAQLGEIYLTRTAYDGTRECLRRMMDCLAGYSDIGAETRQLIARYTLRARFLRTGLAAAGGEHEEAARELAGLRDDDDAHRFTDLEPEQRHLSTLAGVLCAAALCDDDLHVPAAELWQNIIPIVDGLTDGTDEADQLLVAAGIAYGRFCVETGRLAEADQWLHRAGARAQRRGWELYWARAELETAAATWMRGDHESTERLVGSAYPVIAEHSRANDVARCWMYFGLTRLGVGWLAEADESWGARRNAVAGAGPPAVHPPHIAAAQLDLGVPRPLRRRGRAGGSGPHIPGQLAPIELAAVRPPRRPPRLDLARRRAGRLEFRRCRRSVGQLAADPGTPSGLAGCHAIRHR